MTFCVTFWGVRGSIPTPQASHLRYGGNTSCLEVRCGDQVIILDAGTGIRLLGQKLQQEGQKKLSLLLTHTHFDHISGLPFFACAYDKSISLDIYGGHLAPHSTIQHTLRQIMSAPFFPVSPEMFRANITYKDFQAGESFMLGDVAVRTCPLNHPDKATAFRIDYHGKSLCYVTDTEHKVGEVDQNVLALIQGCDLFVYDAMFTDETYPKHVRWGHSTWQEAVRLSKLAGVKQLALFHHNPDHDDTMLDEIDRTAKQAMPTAFVAMEGHSTQLGCV